MKAILREAPHSVFPSQTVIEVWYNGEFIATITGADGPGVRIISKHKLVYDEVGNVPTILEVQVAHG